MDSSCASPSDLATACLTSAAISFLVTIASPPPGCGTGMFLAAPATMRPSLVSSSANSALTSVRCVANSFWRWRMNSSLDTTSFFMSLDPSLSLTSLTISASDLGATFRSDSASPRTSRSLAELPLTQVSHCLAMVSFATVSAVSLAMTSALSLATDSAVSLATDSAVSLAMVSTSGLEMALSPPVEPAGAFQSPLSSRFFTAAQWVSEISASPSLPFCSVKMLVSVEMIPFRACLNSCEMTGLPFLSRSIEMIDGKSFLSLSTAAPCTLVDSRKLATSLAWLFHILLSRPTSSSLAAASGSTTELGMNCMMLLFQSSPYQWNELPTSDPLIDLAAETMPCTASQTRNAANRMADDQLRKTRTQRTKMPSGSANA